MASSSQPAAPTDFFINDLVKVLATVTQPSGQAVTVLDTIQVNPVSQATVLQRKQSLVQIMSNVAPTLEVHHLIPQENNEIWKTCAIDVDKECIVLLSAHHKVFSSMVTLDGKVLIESAQRSFSYAAGIIESTQKFQEARWLENRLRAGQATEPDKQRLRQLRTELALVVRAVEKNILARCGLDLDDIMNKGMLVDYNVARDDDALKLQKWYCPAGWKKAW